MLETVGRTFNHVIDVVTILRPLVDFYVGVVYFIHVHVTFGPENQLITL